MRKLWLLALLACHSPDAQKDDAAPSVSAAPSAVATAAPPLHAAWVSVASKSKVFTDARRTDAENRVKLLPQAEKFDVDATLNAMAKQPATPEGIAAAAQQARDAQDRVRKDTSFTGTGPIPGPAALADAGTIVVHGLIATACAEHGDVASAKALVAKLREMPLPRREDSHGFIAQVASTDRAALDQEVAANLDDKTYQAAIAGAPPPKKNVP